MPCSYTWVCIQSLQPYDGHIWLPSSERRWGPHCAVLLEACASKTLVRNCSWNSRRGIKSHRWGWPFMAALRSDQGSNLDLATDPTTGLWVISYPQWSHLHWRLHLVIHSESCPRSSISSQMWPSHARLLRIWCNTFPGNSIQGTIISHAIFGGSAELPNSSLGLSMSSSFITPIHEE